MSKKITLDDKEYDVENLSDKAKAALSYLQFANTQMRELKNMQALLECAKKRYMENLKKEMLSKKAGLLFGDD